MTNCSITKQSPITESPITKHAFDLEERTLGFSKRVIGVCKQLTQDAINRGLIDQAVRASGSVGANYREANDALSKKDFIHRLRIVRKETKEAHYWLQLLAESNPRLNGEIEPLTQEALELRKIFSAIVEKSA